MEEVVKFNSVDQHNQMYGFETLHPLATVADLSKATLLPTHFTLNYGLYTLFLKQIKCGNLRYGQQMYDYQEGIVTSFAPGQVVEVKMTDGIHPKSHGILFYPGLIRGTSLGQEIEQYSFFSYVSNEVLYPSDEERKIFQDCLDKAQLELSRPIDKHSERLIPRDIELLLDYYMRFYGRRSVTYPKMNKDTLVKFEELLDPYLQNERPQTEGLPTVRYFADKVNSSSNYLGDLVRKGTGKTAQGYIQGKIINVVKEEILTSEKTVSEIAYELGSQYPQHFTRISKKNAGCIPTEYRIIQV